MVSMRYTGTGALSLSPMPHPCPDYPHAPNDAPRRYRGKPCELHPQAMRYAHNRACIECEAAYHKARKAGLAAQESERKRAWKRANPERVREARARHRERYRDSINAKKRAYLKADPRGTLAIQRTRAAMEAAMWQLLRTLARYQREMAERHAREDRARELHAMRYAASMVAGAKGEALSLAELRNRVKRGKHRAKARGLPHSLRAWELAAIGDAQGWACAHCGTSGELVLDHIRPISKGGHHAAGNVQWLCPFHNADKGNMEEGAYRRLRGIPCATPWDVL